MKNKKIKTLILTSISALGILAFGLALANKPVHQVSINAEENVYQLDLFSAISAHVSDGSATIDTANGNSITFSFSGLSFSSGQLTMSSKGYIKNDTPLTGLVRLVSDYRGDISYMNKDKQMVVHDHVIDSPFAFDATICASYFELSNDTAVTFSSLSVTYQCDSSLDKGSFTGSYNAAYIVYDTTAKSFYSNGKSGTLTLNATMSSGHVRYKINKMGKGGSSVGFCYGLSWTSTSYWWEKSTGATYHDVVSYCHTSLGHVLRLATITENGFTWTCESENYHAGLKPTDTVTVDVYFDNATGHVIGLIDGVCSLEYTDTEHLYSGNQMGFRLNDGNVVSEVEIFKGNYYLYESNFNTSSEDAGRPAEWKSVAYGTTETISSYNSELIINKNKSGNKHVVYQDPLNCSSFFAEADVYLSKSTSTSAAFGFSYSTSVYSEEDNTSTQIAYISVRQSGSVLSPNYFSKVGPDYAGRDYVNNTKLGASVSVDMVPNISIKTSQAEIYNKVADGETVHMSTSVYGGAIYFYLDGILIQTVPAVDAGLDNLRCFGLFSAGNYAESHYSNIKIIQYN